MNPIANSARLGPHRCSDASIGLVFDALPHCAS